MKYMLERIKRQYKKVVAVSLACVGVALLIGSFVGNLIIQANSESGMGVESLSGIWNFLLLLVAYGYLLYGNINGTTIAYRGMLIFIFYVLWDFGSFLFMSVMNLAAAGSTGDPALIGLFVAILIGAILALASGILCYIRTRQYISGRYVKYEMVRLWSIFFMASVLLGGALLIAEYVVFLRGIDSASLLFALLEPISMMVMSVVCFFSILRLKSEY